MSSAFYDVTLSVAAEAVSYRLIKKQRLELEKNESPAGFEPALPVFERRLGTQI